MNDETPEEWRREWIDSRDPRVLVWLDRCSACTWSTGPSDEVQRAWKRLDDDTILRVLSEAEAVTGESLPAECEPEQCTALAAALDDAG